MVYDARTTLPLGAASSGGLTMRDVTRRCFLRSAVAASVVLAMHEASSSRSALAAVLPGAERVRRPPGTLQFDVELLLDETGLSGRGSRVDAPSPSGDTAAWERVLVNAQAEPVSPSRPQNDGSRYARVTPEPLSLFTGTEGFLLLAVDIVSGSQMGILIGTREQDREFGARTIGLSAKDGKVELLIFENEVRSDVRGYHRMVGEIGPGKNHLGFAFAEGGRRVGAFVGNGDVGWADDYHSDLAPFDPARMTHIGCWSNNTELVVGTAVAYQPKV
jgi:hypothetical protein